MFHYADVITNQFGLPLSGLSVTVRVAATPAHTGALATIYSDDGVTTKANPMTTSAQGEFDFFVADGSYDIEVTGTGITADGAAAVRIFDPHSAAAADADWKITSATITSGTITTLIAGLKRNAVSASLTLNGSHLLVLMTTGATDKTTTLPTAVGIGGRPYALMKIDIGVGKAVLATTGGQTINNQTSWELLNRYDFVVVASDNANWVVIGKS